jgi:hypothetical protein
MMCASTIRKSLVLIVGLALVALGDFAHAVINVDEVYSNFDGSIQFIVLSRSGHPLPSLAGRSLTATDGGTSQRYTFAADVTADENHPNILVGTQRFADLGAITPDYIMPEGFLPLANGSVAIDDATLDYRGKRLPDDGWHARYRDAASASSNVFVAAAGNSQGHVHSFVRELALTGLWWNAAQPGWGLAVEQQADALFAIWATQDANGSPTWFFVAGDPVFDDVDLFGDGEPVLGAWSGTLYRATGPSASAHSYDPALVVATRAGSMSLQFPVGSETGGSFNFVIGDKSGEHTFTRAVFGEPVRQCFLTATVAAADPRPNYQGLWWNPAESGWALQLTHQGNAIFAIWFTYDDAGHATWFSFTGQRGPNESYAGTLQRTSSISTAGSPAVVNTNVGTASVTFTDGGHGTFAVEMNGRARTTAITREQLAGQPPICQ